MINDTVISLEEWLVFTQALLFLHVEELQAIAEKLTLPSKGNKKHLIDTIVMFLQTGTYLKERKIPSVSCAKPGQHPPLHVKSLMLKGAYKNDLATRNFFKTLIGDHFHFTAFGIDWLKERWMNGHPPTYQEFAQMWQHEYERRKDAKPEPKKEWAYINFVQSYGKKNSTASQEEILYHWHLERQKKVDEVNKILGKIISSS